VKTKLLLVAGITLSLSAFAQNNSQTVDGVEHMNVTPTFRVTVVSRSVQAVNYRHRSGNSKVDFAGTDLMPSANGVAVVNSHRGSITIEAEFGAVFFGAVVVLTMLAAESFDPRLIWDRSHARSS
jgi:hypothetical protein